MDDVSTSELDLREMQDALNTATESRSTMQRLEVLRTLANG